MILEVGFEVLVTMFTVIRGRINSYAGLELSCSLFGCPGWVIRWVVVVVSVDAWVGSCEFLMVWMVVLGRDVLLMYG